MSIQVKDPKAQASINNAHLTGTISGSNTGYTNPSAKGDVYARAEYYKQRDPNNLNTMQAREVGKRPKSTMMRAKKSPLSGVNLGGLNRGFRALTMGSPLVGTALLGTAGYFGGKYLAPYATSLLSPSITGGITYDQLSKEEQESLQEYGGLAGALVAGGIPAFSNFDVDRPWFGLKSYAPMGKEGSGFDYMDPMNTIPIGMAQEAIKNNPNITPMTKSISLGVVNAFNAPPETPISRDDVIKAAIYTGADMLTGGAIGFVAAKAIGFPNPLSTAAVGATVAGLSRLF